MVNRTNTSLSTVLKSVILASIVFMVGSANAQDIFPDDLATEAGDVVVLRALDKITARITEIELPIEQEVRFGTLSIRAKYCRTRPPIETPETFAYLEINDLKRSGEHQSVFEGWMVASSPSLNALEHAVYDVWVINCKITSPESPVSSR